MTVLKSGTIINYADPWATIAASPDLLGDIRFGLAHEIRYRHIIPVSVLTHSALVVALARKHMPERADVIAACAVHDFSEAFLGDIPTDLKRLLPDYKHLEEKWQAVICDKFGVRVDQEIKKHVRLFDLTALVCEMGRFKHPQFRQAISDHGLPHDSDFDTCDAVFGLTDDNQWLIIESALLELDNG